MKYSYSSDDENFYASEDTVEAAIIESGIEVGESILIGEQAEFIPFISADNIIEQLQCDACDEAGYPAEDWLTMVPKDEIDELSELLNAALNKWLEDTCNKPNFYKIVNVKSYERPATPAAKKENE
jgi:hypothetical protein